MTTINKIIFDEGEETCRKARVSHISQKTAWWTNEVKERNFIERKFHENTAFKLKPMKLKKLLASKKESERSSSV